MVGLTHDASNSSAFATFATPKAKPIPHNQNRGFIDILFYPLTKESKFDNLQGQIAIYPYKSIQNYH
ncbi:hypothetical protein [Moraxella lacunata]|uniref:hypothetical protein n=1 Tax=Moraxella lacunata TaxID=477 RepID=UPI003EDF00C2